MSNLPNQRRAPHPATVPVGRAPHPATVQRKEAPLATPKVVVSPHAANAEAEREPHPATVQRKVVPFGGASARAPHAATMVVQRAAAPTWEKPKNKRTKRNKKASDAKQVKKAVKGTGTECLAGADGTDWVKALSGDGGAFTANTIKTYLPKLHAHIAKLANVVNPDEKTTRSGFACAEPNALALLLHAAHIGDMTSIRISEAWDYAFNGFKAPCPNCETWLDAVDEWIDDNDDYLDRGLFAIKYDFF